MSLMSLNRLGSALWIEAIGNGLTEGMVRTIDSGRSMEVISGRFRRRMGDSVRGVDCSGMGSSNPSSSSSSTRPRYWPTFFQTPAISLSL